MVVDSPHETLEHAGLFGKRQRLPDRHEGFRSDRRSQRLDLPDHQRFDGSCRQRGRRAALPALLLGSAADIVAIATRPFDRMTAGHDAVASATAQQPLEESAARQPRALRVAPGLEERLHLLPGAGIYDRVLLACVHLLAVANAADIGDVAEKLAEGVAGKGSATAWV